MCRAYVRVDLGDWAGTRYEAVQIPDYISLMLTRVGYSLQHRPNLRILISAIRC